MCIDDVTGVLQMHQYITDGYWMLSHEAGTKIHPAETEKRDGASGVKGIELLQVRAQ